MRRWAAGLLGSTSVCAATVGLIVALDVADTATTPRGVAIDVTSSASSAQPPEPLAALRPFSTAATTSPNAVSVALHRTRPGVSHGNLSDTAARGLTRQTFARFVNEKGWLDLQDEKGVDVRRYVSDEVAVVKAGGKQALVRSLLPLRAGAGKHKRPVSTTLQPRDGRLRPEQPLTAYSITPDTGTGSLLDFPGSGLKLRLEGSSAAPGGREGQSVIYPNAFEDADALVKPLPTGTEFGFSIRGARSPESYGIRLTLRDGDQLVPRALRRPNSAAAQTAGPSSCAAASPQPR